MSRTFYFKVMDSALFAQECGAELSWSEMSYICGLERGHPKHHRDNRFGCFEWRNFEHDPEPEENA